MAAQDAPTTAAIRNPRVLSCPAHLTTRDWELCDDLLHHVAYLSKDAHSLAHRETLREALWNKVFEQWNSANVSAMRPTLLDPIKGLLAGMPYRELPLGYLREPYDSDSIASNPGKRGQEVILKVTVESDTSLRFEWAGAKGDIVENDRVLVDNKFASLSQAQVFACKHHDRVHERRVNEHNTHLAVWIARHRLAFAVLDEFEAERGETLHAWDRIIYDEARTAKFPAFLEMPKLCREVLEDMSRMHELYGQGVADFGRMSPV